MMPKICRRNANRPQFKTHDHLYAINNRQIQPITNTYNIFKEVSSSSWLVDVFVYCCRICTYYFYSFLFLHFQFEEAIHYENLMRLGFVTKSFDLDFSGSDSSDAMFYISIMQEFAPDTVGADILFAKTFESHWEQNCNSDNIMRDIHMN